MFIVEASEISGQEVFLKEIYGAGGQLFFKLFLQSEEHNFFDSLANAAKGELFKAFAQMWAEQTIRNRINATQKRIFAPVRKEKDRLVIQEEDITVQMGERPTQKLVEETRPVHTARYARQLSGVWKQSGLFQTLILEISEQGRVLGTVVNAEGGKELWNGKLIANRSKILIQWRNGKVDQIDSNSSGQLILIGRRGKTKKFTRENESYRHVVNRVVKNRRTNQVYININ